MVCSAPPRALRFEKTDKEEGPVNKADRAEELFRMGYNCSQSVYAAFAEELGMSVEEAAK